MKATFEVDLSDSAQVNALIAFLQGNGAAAPATPKKPDAKKPAAASASTAKTFTLDELLEGTSAAVKAGHRDVVRAKLNELGAEKTSTLDEAHYDAFGNFLKALKK